jgi:hypothetical protein
VDDPGADAPVYPKPANRFDEDAPGLKQVPVCVMSSALTVAADLALSDPRVNKVLRPPITVPRKGTQDGSFALPDTRHRYVRYVPVAHSRVPKPEGGPFRDDALRSCEGPGIIVNVLASAPPLVPAVRDVLPSFIFERTQYSNSAQSQRLAGVTLILERGWWSSGRDELLAVVVSTPDSALHASSGVPPVVSGWGGDPALSIDGKIRYPLTAADFVRTEQSVTVDGAPQNVVLYCPAFDNRANGWRLDVLIEVPAGAAQPFLQLALMRYQPYAISGMHLSEVVLADFIQLQDKRYASIVPNPHDLTKFRVTVRGPIVDGHMDRSCAKTNRCNAKQSRPGQDAGHSDKCCVSRRRSVEVWLEVASRQPGRSPVWEQHGASITLDATVEGELIAWSGELAVSPRLELPTRRMRVCLMERGLFPGEPVKDDPENLRQGPLYYLDQLEFSMTEYDGDDHP